MLSIAPGSRKYSVISVEQIEGSMNKETPLKKLMKELGGGLKIPVLVFNRSMERFGIETLNYMPGAKRSYACGS